MKVSRPIVIATALLALTAVFSLLSSCATGPTPAQLEAASRTADVISAALDTYVAAKGDKAPAALREASIDAAVLSQTLKPFVPQTQPPPAAPVVEPVK